MSLKEDTQDQKDLKELFEIDDIEDDYDEDVYRIVREFKSQIMGDME